MVHMDKNTRAVICTQETLSHWEWNKNNVSISILTASDEEILTGSKRHSFNLFYFSGISFYGFTYCVHFGHVMRRSRVFPRDVARSVASFRLRSSYGRFTRLLSRLSSPLSFHFFAVFYHLFGSLYLFFFYFFLSFSPLSSPQPYLSSPQFSLSSIHFPLTTFLLFPLPLAYLPSPLSTYLVFPSYPFIFGLPLSLPSLLPLPSLPSQPLSLSSLLPLTLPSLLPAPPLPSSPLLSPFPPFPPLPAPPMHVDEAIDSLFFLVFAKAGLLSLLTRAGRA